jgi:hypothetical protein
MFNNVALDIFIGLVFVFLLYSLLATIVQEIIATWLAFRSKVLEKAILRMLEDGQTSSKISFLDRIKGFFHMLGLFDFLRKTKIAPWFYAHPLIRYLAEDNYYSKPAYLEAKNFSKVIVDLLKGIERPEIETAQSIQNSITNQTINQLSVNPQHSSNPAIREIVRQYPKLTINDNRQNNYNTVDINPDTAIFLKSLWQEAGADVEKFKLRLEQWFDETMERATGWYKRYTQVILFIIGLIMAYIFNVDAIAIKRILTKDKTAREQLVQMAVNNKDKLAGEIELVRNQKIDTSNKRPDTVLKTVYNQVMDDAQKANNVLGLGKPWKDTCKICDSFNNEFKKLIDSTGLVKLKIEELKNQKNQVNKTLLDTTKKLPDSVKLKLTDDIKKIENSLTPLNENANASYLERITTLQDRCLYIQGKRKNKWNLYSPHQSGGWETFFGWVITALAISLGAPFWFDLLSKLTKLRGTGSKLDSTSPGSATTSQQASPPVTVNVNSNLNTGEEAVG